MAKRGRPRKIEVTRTFSRSPFALERHGIEKDPTKDVRWVDPNRIDERKFNDGYELKMGGSAEDGTYRTKGNMVLMERSRDRADESRREKDMRTRQKTQSHQEQLGRSVEDLSRKHGMDLHKLVKNVKFEE